MKKKEGRGRTRILFIGENPDISLFTALQSQGYEAMACDSPQRDCSLVYAFRPHLIVVHLRHPSRNDIATLQECRLVAKGIPIVVTIANPGHETVMRALEEGATSFVSLPVEGAIVKKIVDDLLGSQG